MSVELFVVLLIIVQDIFTVFTIRKYQKTIERQDLFIKELQKANKMLAEFITN